MRVGLGLLGRRRLLQRQRLSDPDRALGRDLVGHRHLAQHQRDGVQLPQRRDVRVGLGVLGRRLLLHGTSPVQTLIERWDGTSWAIVASPNTSATQSNELFPVTCVSASECWAVGTYYNGSAAQTLIERWDGTSWAIVTSPNTSATQENYLYGVTCVSASECWAVGYYYTDNFTPQTLIERWDGPRGPSSARPTPALRRPTSSKP